MMKLLREALVALCLGDDRLQVGISDHGQRLPHGSVSIGRQTIPFTVDKPKLLKQPTDSIVQQIVEQFMKLGYEPSGLELTVGKIRRVYRRKHGSLVLTQQLLK